MKWPIKKSMKKLIIFKDFQLFKSHVNLYTIFLSILKLILEEKIN